MDYKEKYEMALEKARKIHNETEFDYEKGMMEEIFPELKESEDERIRKAILTGLIDCRDAPDLGWSDFGGIEIDDCIAWLEKQGKPNKVEPKLKIESGKWYVCIRNLLDGYGNRAFCKGDVYLSEKDGYLIPCNSNIPLYLPYCVDTYFRNWTFKDAKDGDVLYSIDSKQPFLYKKRPQFSQAIGYCCVNEFGEFAIWNTSKCVICTDKYIPATKEQRNTLEKAMTNAGYRWNKEELKLEKI